VYCDESAGQAKNFLDEMNERNLSVSASVGQDASSPKKDSRKQAIQDFVGNRSQFLFTNSEPSVV